MSDSRQSANAEVGPLTGIYLAVLQFVFTLLWSVYTNYLPELVAQVGLVGSTSALLLMMDQLIFTVTDTATGVAADKVGEAFGRLGIMVGVLAAISCAAFLAMPYIVGTGPDAQLLLIIAIVIWSATSSSLRAPPMKLLQKYRAKPSLPLQTAVVMLGYGLASAVAPYLGLILGDIDVRAPFIVSSIVVLVTALSLAKVERDIAWKFPADHQPAPRRSGPLGADAWMFVVFTLVLALGFQLYLSVDSMPLFQRFIDESDVAWIMPIFWIGYALALFPVGLAAGRYGGLPVMGAAGLLGAAAVLAAVMVDNLDLMTLAHFVAGAAWAAMTTCAFSGAITIGETGAEGKLTGLVFSAMALATFARIGIVAAGWPKQPDDAPWLLWVTVLCWAAGGAGLLALAARRRSGATIAGSRSYTAPPRTSS
jgi:MFS family permease